MMHMVHMRTFATKRLLRYVTTFIQNSNEANKKRLIFKLNTSWYKFPFSKLVSVFLDLIHILNT